MMETIRRMFTHSHWADVRLLDALAAAGEPPAKAVTLFDHVLNAERVWVTRLNGQDSSHLPIWSEAPGLDGMRERIEANRAAYESFLNALDASRMDDIVEYRNQSGSLFRTSIRDILTHVALHGQYHRGQVNLLLRENGFEPKGADFILYVREL